MNSLNRHSKRRSKSTRKVCLIIKINKSNFSYLHLLWTPRFTSNWFAFQRTHAYYKNLCAVCLAVVLFVLFAMSSEFRDTQRKKRVVAGTLSHSGAKERNGTKMSGKKSQQMLNSIFRKPSPTRHTIAENISLSERHFGMLLEPPQTANTREEGEREALGWRENLPLCCFSMRKTIRTLTFR